MTDITPSDTQAEAIKAIEQWFKSLETDENDKLLPRQKQIFRVFGYAGSGKTTITKIAIQECGLSLDPLDNDTRFAAYTGKASLVMRRAGTPARTIHSLIYSVSQASDEEIENAKKKLSEMETAVLQLSPGMERTLADVAITVLREELKKMKQPRFGLNPDSDLNTAKLLVVDEVSMVGPEMAADILSFGKPVLVLGDPGQLPPLKGEGFFTEAKPDVFLTQIHRQAAESPIIHLATMARQGDFIPYGSFGDSVWKMSKRQVSPEMLLAGSRDGQVICGRHASRRELNNAMRAAAGFDLSSADGAEGGRVICLKNKNDIGLINGMFLELSDIEEIDDIRFRAVVKTEDGEYPAGNDRRGKPVKLQIYSGHFKDHVLFDKERNDRDWKAKRNLIEADFGYAITCHKAQGSGWENVIVWDDHLSRTEEDRRRWLYTACSRAVNGLLILD